MVTASPYFKRSDQAQLSITGDWILANYKELKSIKSNLDQVLSSAKTIDFSELNQMDTNGAYLLIKMVGESV
ncbi:ABC transporter permease [Oligella ureolytica]